MSVAFKPAVFIPTNEALEELSRQNPGLRFERNARGDLIVSPPGAQSDRRSVKLIAQLEAWNERHQRGVVFGSSVGFVLPDGSLYSPDAAWVSRDRWDHLSEAEQERFAPLCPDAVFQVASQSDNIPDLQQKMQAYLANGARLGVLIDPYRRTVEMWRPGLAPERLEQPTSVKVGDPLAGLVLEVTSILSPR